MSIDLQYFISFHGADAEESYIDFYDVAQALVGFQRSLALTTHLILNNEIIVQAPSLRGAEIYAFPPKTGSWKWATIVAIGTAVYGSLTAPKDTILGNLTISAYDYVISQALGFHVDFDSTLGEQYEDLKNKEVDVPIITESKMDSLIEKCEPAIKSMHRPLVVSKTAEYAEIRGQTQGKISDLPVLTLDTFDFINFTEQQEGSEFICGKVSSYNINTFRGRLFAESEHRPIPFELHELARDNNSIALITGSLQMNAIDRWNDLGNVRFGAYKKVSRTGRLKSLVIVSVDNVPCD